MIARADILSVLPELVLACSAMALLMFGAFRGDRPGRAASWLAVAALAAAGLAMSATAEGSSFGGQFVVDDFARFMKWLVLLGSALAVVMSLHYNEREGIDRFEYPVLISAGVPRHVDDDLGERPVVALRRARAPKACRCT